MVEKADSSEELSEKAIASLVRRIIVIPKVWLCFYLKTVMEYEFSGKILVF